MILHKKMGRYAIRKDRKYVLEIVLFKRFNNNAIRINKYAFFQNGDKYRGKYCFYMKHLIIDDIDGSCEA